MYVGNTDDGSGMHHMLWEVLGNAVDEHLRGHATRIRVAIDRDRVTIEDDGRGIPPDRIELVMTTLHAGPAPAPHVHLGRDMYGTGVAVACGLSRTFEVTVWQDGREWRQRFARGRARGGVENRGTTSRTGTRLRFAPDFTIFTRHRWDKPMITTRCRELAALIPGLALQIDDESFCYRDLADHVRHLARCEHLLDPLRVRAEHAGIGVDLAIAWTNHARSEIRNFVNCSPGVDGTHLQGMFAALHAVFGARVPSLRRLSASRFRTKISRGMHAMLHVSLRDPRFGNPTREWLTNPEAGDAVRTLVERELARHLDETPALLDALLLQLEPSARLSARG
jgi:DNA gyrase subunit B